MHNLLQRAGQFGRVHHYNRLIRSLAQASESLAATLTTPTHDFRLNGEARVLATIGTDACQIFDVGAHHGVWAHKAASLCPNATIHCFEVSSHIRSILYDNVGDSAVINDFGLADHTATVKVKRFLSNDYLTSLFDYPHERPSVWETELVETGDAYLRRTGITRIDLLKIDAEGAEHLILNGFKETLEQKKVRCIQFEYGRINIITHFLLRDFYQFLRPRGFSIGKVYPRDVEFREYSMDDENFRGPNFLAVLSGESELIARLANAAPA